MFLGLFPWFLLMAAGLVASVVLLFWGYRSGQFAEQERARYLPFRDEEVPAAGKSSGRVGAEIYVLVGLMAASGIALAAALGVAMLRHYSG
jgi:nitrogen fixation-related uncharacterized protein